MLEDSELFPGDLEAQMALGVKALAMEPRSYHLPTPPVDHVKISILPLLSLSWTSESLCLSNDLRQ